MSEAGPTVVWASSRRTDGPSAFVSSIIASNTISVSRSSRRDTISTCDISQSCLQGSRRIQKGLAAPRIREAAAGLISQQLRPLMR
jgi:hypothetical protein